MCLCIYKLFQVLYPKDSLAFFAKRKKNCGTYFFVFVELGLTIPNESNLFFFNLYRFQANPNCFCLAHVVWMLLFSSFWCSNFAEEILIEKTINEVIMIVNLITQEELKEFKTELQQDIKNLFNIKVSEQKLWLLS